MDELRCYVNEKDPDIICLTETWTNEAISDDYLKLHGYETIARNDREDTMGGRGGGILIYAKKEMNCWKEVERKEFVQKVSINLRIDAKEEMAMHVVYRSPNSSKENDEALCKWIRELKGNRMLIGDFNYPGIDWEAGRSDAKGRAFYNVCSDTFLEQQVSESTHINRNRLDLVLTNKKEKIKEIKMDGRLDRSDHEMIVIQIENGMEARQPNHRYRDFNRAKYKDARERFSEIKWEEELRGLDVNGMWTKIKESLTEIIEEFVPWKVKRKQRP